jgi:CMP-N,N'-diacetyllegionaminic acid synthase
MSSLPIKKSSAYSITGARGGSKSVPKKNIMDLAGFPLVAYSIVAGKLTPGIERVILSTDSKEIADIGAAYGAEVPFLRPAELATDNATDKGFLVHALEWLASNEGAMPEFLALLRPTCPLRDPEIVGKAVTALRDNPDATSLRSVHPSRVTPQKMFAIEGKFLRGLFPQETRREYHALPRQSFPLSYEPNGYVDVLRSEVILSHPDVIWGENILAFVTPNTGDIDYQSDVEYVRSIFEDTPWAVYEYLKRNHAATAKGPG